MRSPVEFAPGRLLVPGTPLFEEEGTPARSQLRPAASGCHPKIAQPLARHPSVDLTMARYTDLAPGVCTCWR